jgi:hypothetical protein
MNCANHPDRERTAFCQNCGKPLCPECIRTLGTATFCEPCYVARTAGPAYVPVSGIPPVPPVPPYVPGEPNPGLAALLGFIPGVGAMYNEQYAKGLVHLVVFALLVSLSHENGIFGLFVAGWVFYMVVEAHHTARARRDGTPLPNPFGLNDIAERLGFGKNWPNAAPAPSANAGPAAPPYAPPVQPYAAQPGTAAPYTAGFTAADPYATGYTPVPPVTPPASAWGAPQDTAYPYTPIPPVTPLDPTLPYQRRFPTGALWLIGLGIFFLFGNIHFIRTRYFGPLLLIAFGVFLFIRRLTASGYGLENDGTPHYQWRLVRAIRGSIWLVLSGFLWLLDSLDILHWSQSWPIFLIGGGVLAFLRNTVPPVYPYPAYPAAYPPAPAPAAANPAPVTSTEIIPAPQTPNPDQEGR